MESYKNFVLQSSKVPENFRLVPFVTSLFNDACDNSKLNNSTEKNNCNHSLNGEEASHFYQEVISTPSTSVHPLPKKSKKKVNVSKSSNSSFCNTRLTIFHVAQEGNLEGVQHFLSKECHVDVQDMYGWTPLMCATFEGHTAVVEYLIRQGAKLDIKNKQELTALDIALKKNHVPLINILKNGISNDLVIKKEEINTESKYCDLCQCSYKESSEHNRSIVHLLSSNKNENSSTYYGIPENNKGFQIMLKKGWNKDRGLGINADGRKFPVKTVLKSDRTCIGGKKEIPKVTHFGPNDYRSIKANDHLTLNSKKERRLKRREIRKLESKHHQLQIEFRREFHSE